MNRAGNASAATNNSRVRIVSDCISPRGTVIPRRGATRHFPMSSLTEASWPLVLPYHVQGYREAQTATSELSQKPTRRGPPTASTGRVVLGKVASRDDSRAANQLAHFCFSSVGKSWSQLVT